MDEAERLLSLEGVEPHQVRNHFLRKKPSYNRLLFSNCVTCILLLLSILANIFQSVHIYTSRDHSSIFPELNSLRTITTPTHPDPNSTYNAYQGAPDTGSAEAWQHLLKPFLFNATADELRAAGISANTAVKVKDGGYLANLGVYHELHCLNQIRNFLYGGKSRYGTNEDETQYQVKHLDHCVNTLRLSVMCNADISLYTFTWPKKKQFRVLDGHTTSTRKCIDWDRLEAWRVRRAISPTSTLIYPVQDGI